jgi:hypothetical protein
MSKRLQVLLKDSEYSDVRRAARARNISVAEWVRQALRLACHSGRSNDVRKKLEAIRAAAQFEFPTADIDQMLSEIEGNFRPDLIL